jgi:hypothetical protein
MLDDLRQSRVFIPALLAALFGMRRGEIILFVGRTLI